MGMLPGVEGGGDDAVSGRESAGRMTGRGRRGTLPPSAAEHSAVSSFAAAAGLGLAALAVDKATENGRAAAVLLGAGGLLLAGKGVVSATYEGRARSVRGIGLATRSDSTANLLQRGART